MYSLGVKDWDRGIKENVSLDVVLEEGVYLVQLCTPNLEEGVKVTGLLLVLRAKYSNGQTRATQIAFRSGDGIYHRFATYSSSLNVGDSMSAYSSWRKLTQ